MLEPGITRIGDYAFWSCRNLSGTIELPKGLVEVGASAFLSCAKVTGVTLPDGILRLENNAFSYCTGLEKVVLPSSVTKVGFQAFADCTGLKEFTFQGDAPIFGVDGGSNVFKNVSATAYYPGDNITWTETVRQNYGGTITWTAYEGAGEQPPQGDWEVVASGTCGDQLTWELDETGVLTIDGSGDMYDYTYAQDAPWNTYSYEIRTIC